MSAEVCWLCDGTGIRNAGMWPCGNCDGTGFATEPQETVCYAPGVGTIRHSTDEWCEICDPPPAPSE